MAAYIKRLIRCGYTSGHARQICEDFTRNLSLFDLECFVLSAEMRHVGQV